MLDYQQRVIIERGELDENLVKLDKFLSGATFEGLSVYEQARLNRQATAMRTIRKYLTNALKVSEMNNTSRDKEMIKC
jgi:hypothetical protein